MSTHAPHRRIPAIFSLRTRGLKHFDLLMEQIFYGFVREGSEQRPNYMKCARMLVEVTVKAFVILEK